MARGNVDLLFPNGLEVERDIRTAIYWLNRTILEKRKHSPPWAIFFGKVAAAIGTTKKRTTCTYERQNKGRICAARAERSLLPGAGGQA